MRKSNYQEINFDGLVGPTHHYGGLSIDNLASDSNRAATSSPKTAALQGLQKMRALRDSGFPQAVIPPVFRPAIPALKAFGIAGTTADEILANARSEDPHLLSASSSASSMWTANAGTVAPSCDAVDQQFRIVVANLSSKLHRALEAERTYRILAKIFGPTATVPAIPGGQAMGDEGAANHTRLAPTYGAEALHVFVYGRKGISDLITHEKFLGRQTLLSSQAVARQLQLRPEQCVFIEQSQDVINAGVFHNDVIAVGNLDCYFSHEKAYTDGPQALKSIGDAYQHLTRQSLTHVVVPDDRISVERSVKTYLFNSQLIGQSNQMTLIAPYECQEDAIVSAYLEEICSDESCPIQEVRYFDLRESMRNGGGPACLRLRVVLNEEEISNLGARVVLDDSLFEDLTGFIKRTYPESLTLQDFSNPGFYDSILKTYQELAAIMQLDGVYEELSVS